MRRSHVICNVICESLCFGERKAVGDLNAPNQIGESNTLWSISLELRVLLQSTLDCGLYGTGEIRSGKLIVLVSSLFSFIATCKNSSQILFAKNRKSRSRIVIRQANAPIIQAR